MEKYGFIYIWFDRKRKMFYVGSHWGAEDDGYICSSNRMRDAYRRRPQDFRRKIISNNVSRDILLEEEYKWLSLIKDDELGNKYYNLRKHKWGHWSTDKNLRLKVGEKISQRKKGISIPKDEKWRKSLSESKKGKKLTPEHAAKCRTNGAKTYIVCDPENNIFDVFCLKDFAKQIGLRYSYLARVALGYRKQYKGYRIYKKET